MARADRPAARRSASVNGASAGSAVAPQQNPGTDAARLSRVSPTSGVNTVSPQPSASCCRRLRQRRSASSPSSGATQVSRPCRSRDDGMGVGAERGEVTHGVAHQQTVVRRERQERRRDVCHGGIQAGKAPAPRSAPKSGRAILHRPGAPSVRRTDVPGADRAPCRARRRAARRCGFRRQSVRDRGSAIVERAAAETRHPRAVRSASRVRH